MSVREIARELYRLHKEVESLKRKLDSGSPETREDIEERLRAARIERDRIRKILENKKEKPAMRRPR